MPCFYPLQAFFQKRPDGKKDVCFSNSLARQFYEMGSRAYLPDSLSIPCGRCIGCRLERSRQWAVRCIHESESYDENCFITLTFDDDNLLKQCPGGSLVRSHMQNFNKRLRKFYPDRKIRTFYCGEYGDELGRPHYHSLLFNLDFPDKTLWSKLSGSRYYVSDTLSMLWPYGFSTIGDLTFESAAYVARYCVKKVTGFKARQHYKGKLPEFAQPSLKPGIGRDWIERYGKTDVFPFDELVVRGNVCKPPRYYDKVLEQLDFTAFERMKERRKEQGISREDDNTFRRLQDKEKCMKARMKHLVRSMESER